MIVITDKELETIRKMINHWSYDYGYYQDYKDVKDLEKSLSVAYSENIGEPEGEH